MNSNISNLTNFISGGIAGIVEVTLTHPIDLMKTKIQEFEQTKGKLRTNMNHLFYDYKKLYRGYLPRVIGIFPMRLTYWGCQSYALNKLSNHGITGIESNIIAGIFAGSIQTIIDNPIELIKTRMMTNNKLSAFDIIKDRKFPGFTPTLFRNTIFASCVCASLYYKSDTNHAKNFMLGATGGFIGSILTQPFDYIKTEFQRSKKITKENSWKNMIKLFNEKPLHMFAGWKQRAILGFLNMGIGGLVYFFIRNKLS